MFVIKYFSGFVGTSSKESTDVSEAAKTTVRIIEEHLNSAKDGSGRITGNKLVELLTKKLKGSRNREFCEKLIVNLLLEGYLQEDFHYTVYSVISYVVIGSKWRVYNGKDAIKMRHVEESKSRKRKASSSVEEEDVMVLD